MPEAAPLLEDYGVVVGSQMIDELKFLADRLGGRRVQHINSTAQGGGVAEILNRLIPLFNQLGLDTRWEVLEGNAPFFEMTKKVHNALHGEPERFSRKDFRVYLECNAENLKRLTLDGDAVFIHDPQPAAFVESRRKWGGRWVWRCHVDVSAPQMNAWRFLERFINRFDAAIFSAPQFAQRLSIRQFLIAPSIDPLSEKNRELTTEEVDRAMDQLQIPRDKPIVTQVSRFDRLKDPVGVIEAFRIVKKSVDARLVLAGGGASDDPEGAEVLAQVRQRAGNDPDILILELPPGSNLQINAIQRASAVVVQKSLREGFALTVTEALWKGKPVVASAVGGIPLQIAHKYGGMLCHSVEGAAHRIKQLLNSPGFAERLGKNGREHVRQNFLLTRHLKEYLLLMLALESGQDVTFL
ncbi:MAG: glycosyl transferase family 1 [Candidatus Omnitrophica bacterium CG11_big_fil_rev_8_21_14_0_20_64_10]|nr:MAG: glycosyl transferase family 1 [Candidatus Omnitrophica bacterium CG11_big_fil_rev_8_21_14_0_20_64_10]